MARLRRLAHRVVWLNPLKENPEYAPARPGHARGACPTSTHFASGHDPGEPRGRRRRHHRAVAHRGADPVNRNSEKLVKTGRRRGREMVARAPRSVDVSTGTLGPIGGRSATRLQERQDVVPPRHEPAPSSPGTDPPAGPVTAVLGDIPTVAGAGRRRRRARLHPARRLSRTDDGVVRPDLELRLLGPTRVIARGTAESAGGRVDGACRSSASSRSAPPRPVRRERLMEVFWSGFTERVGS